MPFKTLKVDSTFKPKSLNGLKVFALNEFKVLTIWHKSVALIFHLTYPVEKLTKCYGVLRCADDIRDVILTKSILVCLSRGGIVYTADLQDGVIRKKGQVIDHKEFNFVKNVISINAISEGFLLVTDKGDLMAFCISRAENGRSNISHKMTKNIPGPTGKMHKRSYATSCMPQDIDIKLASLLFKDISLLKCDVIFLGLEDGNVYWLPLLDNNTDGKFNLIHHYNSPIVDIAFASDGKAQRSNHILILYSNGSVGVISQMESQLMCRVHHLPGSILCATLAYPNVIFHTDGVNLWCSEMITENGINATFNTQLLSIKGAVALAHESQTHEVLVGCRHCILYKLNTFSPAESEESKNVAERSETFQDVGSLMQKWQNATQELNLLMEMVATENKILNEISTATRGVLLKDMIKLKIDVSDDFPYALRNTLALKVTNESPQEFSNEFWLFHIQVKTGIWNINVTEKLENPFKPNSVMVFIVPVDAEDLKFPVTVDSSLMLRVPKVDSYSGNAYHFHEIPLQQVSLNVTDFLTPILEEVSVSHQSLSLEDVNWDQFLARFKHVSSGQDTTMKNGESQLLHCYSFKLPEKESWQDFKERMIKKSEQSLHSIVKNANKLKFRVRNSIMTFSCPSDSKTVNIVTTNKYLLSEIQTFIVHKILSKTSESDGATSVRVDEVNYVKVRNIKLALELEAEKGASWKNLCALKRELRTLSSSHLPDWK